MSKVEAFQIGTPAKNYQVVKLDAFKQFHIARRVGPILAEVLTAGGASALKNIEGLSESEKLDALAPIVGKVMEGLSKLSDDEANKVLLSLLSAVQVQQEAGNWAFIATDKALMFQDLELPMMMQLAGKAFMFNLSGFFSGLPRK